MLTELDTVKMKLKVSYVLHSVSVGGWLTDSLGCMEMFVFFSPLTAGGELDHWSSPRCSPLKCL